jgi:hypothetical protein
MEEGDFGEEPPLSESPGRSNETFALARIEPNLLFKHQQLDRRGHSLLYTTKGQHMVFNGLTSGCEMSEAKTCPFMAVSSYLDLMLRCKHLIKLSLTLSVSIFTLFLGG